MKLEDWAFRLGFVLIGVGLWRWSPGLALIYAGGVLIVFACLHAAQRGGGNG